MRKIISKWENSEGTKNIIVKRTESPSEFKVDVYYYCTLMQKLYTSYFTFTSEKDAVYFANILKEAYNFTK